MYHWHHLSLLTYFPNQQRESDMLCCVILLRSIVLLQKYLFYIYGIGVIGIMLMGQLIQAHIRQICLLIKEGMFVLFVLFTVCSCRVPSDTEILRCMLVCAVFQQGSSSKGCWFKHHKLISAPKLRMKKAPISFIFLIWFRSSFFKFCS